MAQGTPPPWIPTTHMLPTVKHDCTLEWTTHWSGLHTCRYVYCVQSLQAFALKKGERDLSYSRWIKRAAHLDIANTACWHRYREVLLLPLPLSRPRSQQLVQGLHSWQWGNKPALLVATADSGTHPCQWQAYMQCLLCGNLPDGWLFECEEEAGLSWGRVQGVWMSSVTVCITPHYNGARWAILVLQPIRDISPPLTWYITCIMSMFQLTETKLWLSVYRMWEAVTHICMHVFNRYQHLTIYSYTYVLCRYIQYVIHSHTTPYTDTHKPKRHALHTGTASARHMHIRLRLVLRKSPTQILEHTLHIRIQRS